MRGSAMTPDVFEPGARLVLVSVSTARGSVPRTVGAWMAVGPDATLGTIGGGQREYMAIDAARALDGGRGTLDVPLGPEIGQCCGGRVTLSLERVSLDAVKKRWQADQDAHPTVLIFGAGHTGRALAAVMAHMPVQVRVVDSRAEALATVPADMVVLSAVPEAEVRAAPAGSAFVVLTHDHALDFLITQEALARGDAAYVGLIGSATKRTRFERWMRDNGGSSVGLTCPIGAGRSKDKRPEVVAAFTAAEILEHLTVDAPVAVPS